MNRVRVLSFARVREIVGASACDLEVRDGATARDVWNALAERHPALTELAASTRLARNGRVVPEETRVGDGDEIALLPPVGGG